MKFHTFGDSHRPVALLLPGTTVHCFYAAKMGERYLNRYKKYFKTPVIHSFCLEHEELLICYPKLWAEEIKEIMESGRKVCEA